MKNTIQIYHILDRDIYCIIENNKLVEKLDTVFQFNDYTTAYNEFNGTVRSAFKNTPLTIIKNNKYQIELNGLSGELYIQGKKTHDIDFASITNGVPGKIRVFGCNTINNKYYSNENSSEDYKENKTKTVSYSYDEFTSRDLNKQYASISVGCKTEDSEYNELQTLFAFTNGEVEQSQQSQQPKQIDTSEYDYLLEDLI